MATTSCKYLLILLVVYLSSISASFISIPIDVQTSVSAEKLEEGLYLDPRANKQYGAYRKRSDIAVSINYISMIVPINVGASNAPFKVLLDTGSTLFAIPSSNCGSKCDANAPNPPLNAATVTPVNCSNTACKSCCNGNNCPANQCFFSVQYVDKSGINGSLVTDTVTFGGLSAQMTFGGITQESPKFVAPSADGILGMAAGGSTVSCSPSCVTPVFDVLVANNLVGNSFGLYVGTGSSGVLNLGSVDTTRTGSNYLTVPMTATDFYIVDLKSVSINGKNFGTSFGPAIVDSGTTFTLFPPAMFSNFQNTIQSNCGGYPLACGSTSVFNNYCIVSQSNVQKWPTLVYNIGNIQVSVPPSTYFIPQTDNGKITSYCLGIEQLPGATYSILGYSFLRGRYTYFDRQNLTIGFSNANGGDSSSSSSDASAAYAPVALILAFLIMSL